MTQYKYIARLLPLNICGQSPTWLTLAMVLLWLSRPSQKDLLLIPMASFLCQYELRWLYFSIISILTTGDRFPCVSCYLQSLKVFAANFSGFRFVYMLVHISGRCAIQRVEDWVDERRNLLCWVGRRRKDGASGPRVTWRNCTSFIHVHWKETTVH